MEEHKSFLWGHWYPCFGRLVTSALGFQSQWWISFTCACFVASVHNKFLRFTSGATPADVLVDNMAFIPFHSMYLCTSISFLFYINSKRMYKFNPRFWEGEICPCYWPELVNQIYSNWQHVALMNGCHITVMLLELDRIITISIPITIKFSIENNGHFRVTPITICPGFSSLNYSHGTLIRIPQIGSQSASFNFCRKI